MQMTELGGTSLIQIQAGGNGLWAIGSAQQIYRFDSSSQSLVQIPGALGANRGKVGLLR